MGLLESFQQLSEADGIEAVDSYLAKLTSPEQLPAEGVAYRLPFMTGMITQWKERLEALVTEGKLTSEDCRTWLTAIGASHLALVNYAEALATQEALPSLGNDESPPDPS